MGYAIRKDGKGWRAVNGPEDVSVDENYSAEQPGPMLPTNQDLRATELKALLVAYQADILTLQSAWVSALIADGDLEEDRKADIAAEIAEVKAQYVIDVAAVKSNYPI